MLAGVKKPQQKQYLPIKHSNVMAADIEADRKELENYLNEPCTPPPPPPSSADY